MNKLRSFYKCSRRVDPSMGAISEGGAPDPDHDPDDGDKEQEDKKKGEEQQRKKDDAGES